MRPNALQAAFRHAWDDSQDLSLALQTPSPSNAKAIATLPSAKQLAASHQFISGKLNELDSKLRLLKNSFANYLVCQIFNPRQGLKSLTLVLNRNSFILFSLCSSLY